MYAEGKREWHVWFSGIPGAPQKEVYFMGLIDVLTQYDTKKKAAHAAKTVKHGVSGKWRFYLVSFRSVRLWQHVASFSGWCWNIYGSSRTVCQTIPWIHLQHFRIRARAYSNNMWRSECPGVLSPQNWEKWVCIKHFCNVNVLLPFHGYVPVKESKAIQETLPWCLSISQFKYYSFYTCFFVNNKNMKAPKIRFAHMISYMCDFEVKCDRRVLWSSPNRPSRRFSHLFCISLGIPMHTTFIMY